MKVILQFFANDIELLMIGTVKINKSINDI